MTCVLRTYDDVALVSEILVTASDCHPGTVARALGWIDPTAATVFEYPTSELLMQAWVAGFGLPCSLYLAAYCVGCVVRFFDKR